MVNEIRRLREAIERQQRVIIAALAEVERHANERVSAAAATCARVQGTGCSTDHSPSGEELLTAREAQRRLKISASTFYEWIRDGRLPGGIKYGPRSRRWRASELVRCIEAE